MKKTPFFLAFCLVFSMGCATLGSTPEVTPITLSDIPETAEPTSVPDDIAKMLDGEPVRLLVVPQKFSIEVNALLMFETDDYSVSATNDANDFLISFIAEENPNGLSLNDILGQYFAALERRQMVLEYQPSVEFTVKGNQGIRVDFLGRVQEQTVEGSAIAIQSDDEWVLIGAGMANTSKANWKDTGLPNFNQMVDSIEFLDTSAECPVSTDDSYGYTPENPIKVGGDFFGGASREQAYLDHLLDANGEKVTYERSGSNDFGDVVLDIYVVTMPAGNEVSLYVDMYNYTPPHAPVGFTCHGAFPLSAP